MSPDVQRLEREATALRHWSGGHVPQLLEADASLGAILLEEIAPGTTLQDIGRYPRVIDLTSLLAGLHRTHTPAGTFPPLSQRIAYLFASWERPRRRNPPLVELVPSELLDRGQRLAHRLARSSSTQVLLHGDLTPVNILDGGQDRGMVAIDPAPCIGDSAFDAIDVVLWRARSLHAVEERTDQLGTAIGVDSARLLSWCAAFAAMAAMDVAQLPHAPAELVRTLLDLADRVPAK
ncbi:MAG: aminoglycoside phosphotransferase family protein [Chloroflexota bacterium]|nr:aminoglycoside phosphotransferase family protein [Chloroflexota bacterium]